jgi:hypothetical protein
VATRAALEAARDAALEAARDAALNAYYLPSGAS